jgi:hypothetical protein
MKVNIIILLFILIIVILFCLINKNKIKGIINSTESFVNISKDSFNDDDESSYNAVILSDADGGNLPMSKPANIERIYPITNISTCLTNIVKNPDYNPNPNHVIPGETKKKKKSNNIKKNIGTSVTINYGDDTKRLNNNYRSTYYDWGTTPVPSQIFNDVDNLYNSHKCVTSPPSPIKTCEEKYYLNKGKCIAHKDCNARGLIERTPGTKNSNAVCGSKKVCICLNGVPAKGTKCPSMGDTKCQGCGKGFYLQNNSCVPHTDCNSLGKVQLTPPTGTSDAICGGDKQCSCENGKGTSGKGCKTHGYAKCTTCGDGYSLQKGSCVPKKQRCDMKGRIPSPIKKYNNYFYGIDKPKQNPGENINTNTNNTNTKNNINNKINFISGNICHLSKWSLWGGCNYNTQNMRLYNKKKRTRTILNYPKDCYSPMKPALEQIIDCSSSSCT